VTEAQPFKNVKAAIEWYKENGGILKQTSLYKKIEANPDKTVSRFWMSEFLRKEQQKQIETRREVVDFGEQKAALDLEEQKLKIDKLRREGRKDDKEYIKRETVHEREGALVGQILGETRYQLGKAVDAVITVGKADPAKRPEIARLLDETILSAYRAIYESGEIDITFEDVEE